MEPLEKLRNRLVASTPRVLVAVPCYNEEETIAEVVRLAREYADEVLVINDGSKDRTAEVAEAAGATVSHNPGNKGKGYGVRRAFQYAYEGDYDALVLMDGDLQHDPAEIPALLAPILRNDDPVDIGLGFRFGETTEMPLWRKAGKRVLDYATAVMGAGIVTDSQCGYRAAPHPPCHGRPLEPCQAVVRPPALPATHCGRRDAPRRGHQPRRRAVSARRRAVNTLTVNSTAEASRA